MIIVAVTALTRAMANGLGPTGTSLLTRYRRPDCVVRHFPTPVTIADIFAGLPARAQPTWKSQGLDHLDHGALPTASPRGRSCLKDTNSVSRNVKSALVLHRDIRRSALLPASLLHHASRPVGVGDEFRMASAERGGSLLVGPKGVLQPGGGVAKLISRIAAIVTVLDRSVISLAAF
jgi:hypothetical protein